MVGTIYQLWFWFLVLLRGPKVKWFVDGAEFNSNHEMLFWLWGSTLADTNWSTKFPFACIPMRYLPNHKLREDANKEIVKTIAWDSFLEKL